MVVVVEVVLADVVLVVVGGIVVVVVGGAGLARTKFVCSAKLRAAFDSGVLVHPPNKPRRSVADAVRPLNCPAVTVPVSCGDKLDDDRCGHVSVTVRVDGFPLAHVMVAVPLVVLGNPENAAIRQFVVVGDVTVRAIFPEGPAGPVHVFTLVPPLTVVIFRETRLVSGYLGSGGLKNARPATDLQVSPTVAPPDGATRVNSPIVTATTTTNAILRRIRASPNPGSRRNAR